MDMISIKNGRTAFIDCDDTLVLWDYQDYPESEHITITEGDSSMTMVPHDYHIKFIKNLKVQGYGLVVWSAAGGEWADKVAKLLNLEDIIDICIAKPEFVMDDLFTADQIIKSIVYFDPKTHERVNNG